jgi:Fur family ferric uptake transcriptional regulator
MTYLQQIIKAHGLRVTDARLAILDAFLRTGKVFDHHALWAACGGRVDRVTLYRTLHVFLVHRLLYKVPSATGLMQYGLCSLSGEGTGNHLHLVCRVCGRITSVDSFAPPAMPLPPGFRAASVDFIVGGTCKDCLTPPVSVPPPGERRPRGRERLL